MYISEQILNIWMMNEWQYPNVELQVELVTPFSWNQFFPEQTTDGYTDYLDLTTRQVDIISKINEVSLLFQGK